MIKYYSVNELVTKANALNKNSGVICIYTYDSNDKKDLKRIAETASHGQVRAINPVNTSLDGDTVFVFTTKEMEFPLSSLGKKISNGSDWWKLVTDIIAQAAARVVQESIYDACNKAKTIKMDLAYQGIIPSTQDYK